MATHVVWDWNGTLLDDLDCCLDVTNRMLAEFGLPVLDGVAAYQSVFRFPIAEYYADLGFDTSPDGNFDAAARRYVELYEPASAGCRLQPGAADVLAALHASGVRQVVISASEQQRLLAQLAPFGLDGWLDGAHGIEDIYAASKRAVAQSWLESGRLDPSQVVFVGDSEHDFEIADGLGARCVLYSGGHHSRTHLASLGAPIIDHLSQVTDYVW